MNLFKTWFEEDRTGKKGEKPGKIQVAVNRMLTSKMQLIEALKNNICGKLKRELLKGSIEVYPITNYGAIEMGYHRFHNLQEKSTSGYYRFVHIWKRENGKWRITRVVSLHS